jgi:hypothetical protein
MGTPRLTSGHRLIGFDHTSERLEELNVRTDLINLDVANILGMVRLLAKIHPRRKEGCRKMRDL